MNKNFAKASASGEFRYISAGETGIKLHTSMMIKACCELFNELVAFPKSIVVVSIDDMSYVSR